MKHERAFGMLAIAQLLVELLLVPSLDRRRLILDEIGLHPEGGLRQVERALKGFLFRGLFGLFCLIGHGLIFNKWKRMKLVVETCCFFAVAVIIVVVVGRLLNRDRSKYKKTPCLPQQGV